MSLLNYSRSGFCKRCSTISTCATLAAISAPSGFLTWTTLRDAVACVARADLARGCFSKEAYIAGIFLGPLWGDYRARITLGDPLPGFLDRIYQGFFEIVFV